MSSAGVYIYMHGYQLEHILIYTCTVHIPQAIVPQAIVPQIIFTCGVLSS